MPKVAGKHYPYTKSGKQQAACELEAIGAPCPRDFVVDNCSVAARMIIDYGDLREKIWAAKNGE